MKKLMLLVPIFIFIIPFVFAACCYNEGEVGDCYPGRNTCCEEGDLKIGYIGCKYAVVENPRITEESDFDYVCPGEKLGDCLICKEDCSDSEDCPWEELLDACDEYNCVIEYLSGTTPKIPLDASYCSDGCPEGLIKDAQGVCVEQDGTLDCLNEMCVPTKYCCQSDGSYDTEETQGIEGAVCSGDNDDDGICNIYDNCAETPNGPLLGTCLPFVGSGESCITDEDCTSGTCGASQLDSDQDEIGDVCEFGSLCESAYGDKQCCNDPYDVLSITSGDGTFYGFTEDCPKEVGKSLGCWTECVGTHPEYGEVTYEVGPCIEGTRTIKVLRDGSIVDTMEEPCSDIPLIPFFTTFNLLATLMILFLFYFLKER